MNKKGTILIVDDRIQEKIGVFKQYLDVNGYNVEVAETLDMADKMLKRLLGSSKLDGIILDFSFPVNEKNQSVNINDIPNGVYLFRKYEFKLRNQRVPIIINTTGDEEYKRKYLGPIENLRMPVYNVNHESNPLARPSGNLIKEVIGMFDKRFEERNLANSIKSDNSLRTGKTVIQGPDGKYHYSRYDGD